MSATASENSTKRPPREWVNVSPEKDDGDPPCVSSYIAKFYWRERDDEPNELHVVFQEDDGPNARYRYFDVPRDVYDEMYKRAYHPDEHELTIGRWFFKNVRDEYEYERYKN